MAPSARVSHVQWQWQGEGSGMGPRGARTQQRTRLKVGERRPRVDQYAVSRGLDRDRPRGCWLRRRGGCDALETALTSGLAVPPGLGRTCVVGFCGASASGLSSGSVPVGILHAT